jgi:hypothetical protein
MHKGGGALGGHGEASKDVAQAWILDLAKLLAMMGRASWHG